MTRRPLELQLCNVAKQAPSELRGTYGTVLHCTTVYSTTTPTMTMTTTRMPLLLLMMMLLLLLTD